MASSSGVFAFGRATSAKPRRSRTARARLGWSAIVACLALSVVSGAAGAEASGGRRVIPPGHEQELQDLARPFTLGGEVTPGWRLAGLAIGDAASFSFVLGKAETQIRWTLALEGETVTPPAATLAPDGRAALEALQAVVRPRLTTAFWNGLFVVPQEPPRPPPPAPLPSPGFGPWGWIAVGVALLGLVVLERRARSLLGAIAALGLVGAAAFAVLASHRRMVGPSPSEQLLAEAQHEVVRLLLGVAVVALVPVLVGVLRRARSGRDAALDAALVLGWSLFVRVVLTTPNILTDGGSGWGRLLGLSRDFAALSVIVNVLLPDPTMVQSIWVPRLLAAALPPLVVLLGRSLGLARLPSALAGLAIASLPLHAALFTSDFEVGAILTLLVLGLLLVAAAAPDRVSLFAAGAAVLAFAIWGRPEAVVVGLPLLVLATRFGRSFWTRPAVVASVVWLGLSTILRLVSTHVGRMESRPAFTPLELRAFVNLPLAEFFTTSAVLPVWFWLSAPLGLLLVRGVPRWFVLAGLLAGYAPFVVMPATGDPTQTFVEVFRYGAVALPFIALVSGLGLAACCAWVSRRVAHPAAGLVAPAFVVVAMLATPLVNRDYLGREYGPSLETAVFREALTHVPAGCQLLVPDDDVPGSRMLEVRGRYLEIQREADPEGLANGTAPRLLPISAFVARARGDRLPTVADLAPEDRTAKRDPVCWVYFSGAYCNDGFAGAKPTHCAEFEDRFKGAPLWTKTAEYRSHRLITRPGRTDAPYYVPALELGLYRVGR